MQGKVPYCRQFEREMDDIDGMLEAGEITYEDALGMWRETEEKYEALYICSREQLWEVRNDR